MGAAAQLAKEILGTEPQRIAALLDRLWEGIADLPGVQLNGPEEERSCSHLNVAFGGCDGEMLLLSLRQLAVATGSACTSATMAPSYVLKAIGLCYVLDPASLLIRVCRFS